MCNFILVKCIHGSILFDECETRNYAGTFGSNFFQKLCEVFQSSILPWIA